MEFVLSEAGFWYGLSVVAVSALFAIGMVLLSQPVTALGNQLSRAWLRHRLAGTRVPKLLQRLGGDADEFTDERSTMQLRAVLQRCQGCQMTERCDFEIGHAGPGRVDISFCSNRYTIAAFTPRTASVGR
jgi:hypothetical protein